MSPFFLLFTKLDGLPSLTVPLLVKPHHLFQVSVAERVRQVPAHANQDDFFLEAVAFEVDHVSSGNVYRL
jgi:hypothetical protein